MDQKRLDLAFNGARHLNTIADLMNGRNLAKHQVTVQEDIEAVDFIIEQEGYLHPDIDDLLDVKRHLGAIAGFIQKGIDDPAFKPDIIEWLQNSPGH